MRYELGSYSGIDPATERATKTVAQVFCDGELRARFQGPNAIDNAMHFMDGANDALERVGKITKPKHTAAQ